MSLQSNPRYDFAVHDRQGAAAAVFEAKRRSNTSREWARHWHENVVERADGFLRAHVVLVTLDRLYGWRPDADANAEPDWELEARGVFQAYFKRLKIDPSSVEPRVFEEVVGMWLRDVANETTPEGSALPDHEVVAALRAGVLVNQTFA